MNDKIKAQFFAQYLGQNIEGDPQDDEDYKIKIWKMDLEHVEFAVYEHCTLLLRKVDQLTDEESLQVGIKAFPMFVPFPEKDHDTLRKLALTVLYRGHLSWVTRQTLIGYGVLVPFLYIDENKPITLTTDEIISLGWAKIKEA